MLARSRSKKRGVAIVLAMFFAIIAFASASLVVLQVSQDLRTSSLGALQTQKRLAVQGAVNHLLSLLKRGDGSQYTASAPLVLEIGGVPDIKVWAVPDASVAGALHLRAELSGFASAKTVVSRPEITSRLFFEGGDPTGVGGNTLYTQEPGDPGWTTLPDPPSLAYNALGQAVTLSLFPDGAGNVIDVEANGDGQMLAQVFANVGGSSVEGTHLWDNNSQSWSTLPPLPSFTFSNNTLNLGTTYQEMRVGGFSDDKVFVVCSGGLAVYNTTNLAWEYYPPPTTSGEPGHFATAGGGKFALQMEDQNDPYNPAWISLFEDGAWSNIAVPDAGLIPVGITPEGDLYAAYLANGQPTTTRVLSVNGWQTVSTPTSLDGMLIRAVDGEGNLVYSSAGSELKVWDPQSTQVESTTLPPGTNLPFSLLDDSRQLAGGGQESAGAQSVLEVVSSY